MVVNGHTVLLVPEKSCDGWPPHGSIHSVGPVPGFTYGGCNGFLHGFVWGLHLAPWFASLLHLVGAIAIRWVRARHDLPYACSIYSVYMFLWITHGRDERAEIILCESWEWWGSCAWNMCRYYPWQPTRMMLCIFTNLRASYISRRSHFSCRSMQFHLLYGFSRKFHPHLCNSLDIGILNLFSSLHWLLFYFSSSLHAGCSVKYGCSHCGCRGYAHIKWGMLYIICYLTSIHPVWKKFLESFWKYKFGATIATTPSPECGASC